MSSRAPHPDDTAIERERTRLIAWLAEYQISTGTTIEREMTADALMADFIAPLLRCDQPRQPTMTDDDLRHLCKLASVGLAGMQDPDFMRWLAWDAEEKDRADYRNAIGIIGDAFAELARRQGMLPTFRLPAARQPRPTTITERGRDA